MRRLRLIGCVLIGTASCSNQRWDGQIQTWGGMREVMHDGQTDGRVSLRDVLAKPHAFGIGAVQDLRGEIIIDDGRCLVGQTIESGSAPAVQGEVASPSLRATLLAVAYVPAWSDALISEPLSSSEVEDHVQNAARRAGFDTTRPFPFVIEGQLVDLHAHVINGYCPMSADVNTSSVAHTPFRVDGWSGAGKLIGFFAESSAGKLTHHGTSVHMHVLTEAPQPIIAHVEEVSLAAGARLRLPKL